MKKVEKCCAFNFKADMLPLLNKKNCQTSSTKVHSTDKLQLRLPVFQSHS